MDAKGACDKLNGFNFQNRYLVVLYHQPEKSRQHFGIWRTYERDILTTLAVAKSQADLAERQENLEKLKQQHGIS